MIHYHGVPLSGGLQTEIAMQGKRGFVYYAHARRVGLVAEICKSCGLENVALTSWRAGKALDGCELAEFVGEWFMLSHCD